MNKKKFNKVIDDAIDRLEFKNNNGVVRNRGVCHAICAQYCNDKITSNEYRKLKNLFGQLIREISECPDRAYFLGDVCKENVAYRTYMLEWFRYFVNEYEMYETLKYRGI